jgi:hypothetical protein
MSEHPQNRGRRNRSDHVLSQGYLDGFTNPSNQGKVCVFDRQRQRWFDTGTAGVAAIKGFYDYPQGSEPDQTADRAFAGLEAKFPGVRRELVASGFSGWVKQIDFLLAFAQMLRTRSELFREQHLAHSRGLTILKVEEVLQKEPSKTKPGTFDTTLKVGPYAAENETERETLLRNKTITDMRTEIAKGPAWLSDLHWCLRFTGNPTDPVITADNSIVVDGRVSTLEEALRDPETLVFFPISWQACLVGSTAKFDKETDAFHPRDLKRLRAIYLESARRFVFSPARLVFHEPAQWT